MSIIQRVNLFFHYKIQLFRQTMQLKQAEKAFSVGNIDLTKSYLKNLYKVDGRSFVLQSRMHLFASEFAEAECAATRAMWILPPWSRPFKQAFYIRQESLRKQGKFALARDLMRNIPFKDPCNQYFRSLRLAVDTEASISFYEGSALGWPPFSRQWFRASSNYLLMLRDIGQIEQAIHLATDLLEKIYLYFPFGAFKFFSRFATKSKDYWAGNAEAALADLDHHLRLNRIEMFLISGTLLGCIREGRFLGHDKDIDVGVDEKVSMNTVRQVLLTAKQFKCREIYSENALYVEHINGIHVDIFRHYNTIDGYIHSGIKAEWINSPFTLQEYPFLGRTYLIPSNYDIYLQENYGDWKIPMPEFETFTDTPNMRVSNIGNYRLYLLMSAAQYYLVGDQYKYSKILQSINAGEASPKV